MEPTNAHGGLQASDFESPGVLRSLRNAIDLLPPSKRRLLALGASAQISLGILDFIGIALIGLVAAIAVSGLGIASIPQSVQATLDSLGLGGITVSQLSVIVALVAVTTLIAKSGLSALMTRRITRFLANRQAEASARLAREYLNRPLAQVQRWTMPEASFALGPSVSAATVALLGASIILVSEVFLFSIVGIGLLVYDPLLTLSVGVLFAVIGFFLYRILGRWSERNAETLKETSIRTLGAVSEALATYRESSVLNRRDFYVDRFESLVGRSAVASANTSFIAEVPKYVLESTLYLGILVLATIQFLTRDWATAAATVALFLAAGTRVIPALLRMQGAGITIRNASVQAQPAFFMSQYLTDSPATAAIPPASKLHIIESVASDFPDFSGTVSVADAWLQYPGSETPALAGVDLEVQWGSSVAFVGPTGAGKSSLADLVLGVYEPDAGVVLVGEKPPREAINIWPGAISYVPQAVALVSGSVRENVALGFPIEVINDDLVWEALHRAHLADYLVKQREGLETAVGERGFRLSGGQRQRLGIARALYTRPKLLILDEATSALDSETELAIMKALEELEGSVTSITIAHRLATVRHADQVLYLDHGKVLARGSFSDVRIQVQDFDRQASLLGL